MNHSDLPSKKSERDRAARFAALAGESAPQSVAGTDAAPDYSLYGQVPSKVSSTYWLPSANPLKGGSFYSNEYTGKWCIVTKADQIDEAWGLVKAAVARGELVFAKVSTRLSADLHGGKYVICVYTRDWRDEADLLWSREVLHTLGFTQKLGYKRDIETVAGVYGTAHEWYRRI